MIYSQLPGINKPISRITLGCGALYSNKTWGIQYAEDSYRTIQAALQHGINTFDTAASYGSGYAEELLGDALKIYANRHEVVIGTKVSSENGTRKGIEKACDDSLSRLRTDYIDLYQVHWLDPLIPLEETMSSLHYLKVKGKILNYGVSNCGYNSLLSIPEIYSPVSNQLPYNLLWRVIEHKIKTLCREQNIGLMIYCPLMQGLLTGKFKSVAMVPSNRARTRLFAHTHERAKHQEDGHEELMFNTIYELKLLCRQEGISLTHLSLAWLLMQEDITTIIVGARTPEQIVDNVMSLSVQLSDEVIRKLDKLTESLKTDVGENPDLWQTKSRIN